MADEQLIDVEYLAGGNRFEFVRKRGRTYKGIIRHRDGGITCLAIRAPAGTRNHYIEVGNVYAITRDGTRHVLETPNGRWKLRAQEIHKLLDGNFSEDWAADYFDPASPLYFKREQGYEPEIDQELEAKFATSHTAESTGPPQGAGCFEAIGLAVLVVLFLVWLF